MTADREQVRRDAEQYAKGAWMEPMPAPVKLARHCLALLAELEQAERDKQERIAAYDRDAARFHDSLQRANERGEQAERERDEAASDSQEISVSLAAAVAELAQTEQREAALVEALGEIADVVKTRSTGVRMDGTTEWPTPMHKQVYELADAALAAHEQAQG